MTIVDWVTQVSPPRVIIMLTHDLTVKGLRIAKMITYFLAPANATNLSVMRSTIQEQKTLVQQGPYWCSEGHDPHWTFNQRNDQDHLHSEKKHKSFRVNKINFFSQILTSMPKYCLKVNVTMKNDLQGCFLLSFCHSWCPKEQTSPGQSVVTAISALPRILTYHLVEGDKRGKEFQHRITLDFLDAQHLYKSPFPSITHSHYPQDVLSSGSENT